MMLQFTTPSGASAAFRQDHILGTLQAQPGPDGKAITVLLLLGAAPVAVLGSFDEVTAAVFGRKH